MPSSLAWCGADSVVLAALEKWRQEELAFKASGGNIARKLSQNNLALNITKLDLSYKCLSIPGISLLPHLP